MVRSEGGGGGGGGGERERERERELHVLLTWRDSKPNISNIGNTDTISVCSMSSLHLMLVCVYSHVRLNVGVSLSQ